MLRDFHLGSRLQQPRLKLSLQFLELVTVGCAVKLAAVCTTLCSVRYTMQSFCIRCWLSQSIMVWVPHIVCLLHCVATEGRESSERRAFAAAVPGCIVYGTEL